MKKLISRRNFLAAMGTMAAAGVLTPRGKVCCPPAAVLPLALLPLLPLPVRLPLLRRAGVM